MIIRNVQKEDIPVVKVIADSLVVTPEFRDKDTGFYDYSLTLEQYERRINSDLFLVACRNSELEGFCMAYDSDFVKKLLEQEPKLRRDVVFNYLNQLDRKYVYVDQLASRKPGSFIGSTSVCKLIDRLKKMSKGKNLLIGAIPHHPWKNNTSIRFYEHQGAKLIEEIGSKDKILFGIYRIDLV